MFIGYILRLWTENDWSGEHRACERSRERSNAFRRHGVNAPNAMRQAEMLAAPVAKATIGKTRRI
jgi:hypothetical protein